MPSISVTYRLPICVARHPEPDRPRLAPLTGRIWEGRLRGTSTLWRRPRCRRFAAVAAVLRASGSGPRPPLPAATADQAVRPWLARPRRSVLPARRQRRVRRQHYDLDLAYDPATDVLSGVATIRAQGDAEPVSFNLDLDGLTVRSIRVNGRRATWTRADDELTVTPKRRAAEAPALHHRVAYDGVPQPIATRNSASRASSPPTTGRSSPASPRWPKLVPVNDHPLDKAAYTFHIKVPDGPRGDVQRRLKSQRSRHGSTTWSGTRRSRWRPTSPRRPWRVDLRLPQGRHPLLGRDRPGPVHADLAAHGRRVRHLAGGGPSYKRLSRTISVPAGGVAALVLGRRAPPSPTGTSCSSRPTGGPRRLDDAARPQRAYERQHRQLLPVGWQAIHPFLAHYQTVNDDGSCSPTGTTGVWQAATGAERRLRAVGGRPLRLRRPGRRGVDQLRQRRQSCSSTACSSTTSWSRAAGLNRFEDDGDTLDGWTVPGPPAGSPGNENDWIEEPPRTRPRRPARSPPARSRASRRSSRFLGDLRALSVLGRRRDRRRVQGLGFALETQTGRSTRRTSSTARRAATRSSSTSSRTSGPGQPGASPLAAHLAHEGFATYASGRGASTRGSGPRRSLDSSRRSRPTTRSGADDRRPGPDQLFDIPVY